MKFKIGVSDLQYALRLARDVVPSSGPTAESTGVLIKTKGNRAVFVALSLDVLAEATVQVETLVEGQVVVSAADFYNAISKFQPLKEGIGTSDVLVSFSKSTRKLNITTKTTYYSGVSIPHKRAFPTYNHEFFPAVPSIQPNKIFKIPAKEILQGIEGVLYAASSDKTRIIFTGILFKLADSILTLTATDGVCLAEYSADVDYSGEPIEVVMPAAFAGKIVRNFFETDILEAAVTDSRLYFKTPNLTLGGILINEAYPNYKPLLPVPEVVVRVEKFILLDNIRNLTNDASSVEDGRVSLKFDNNKLSLECGHSSNGEIATDFSGNYQVDCTLKLLLQSVNALSGEEVYIGLAGNMRPVTFSSFKDQKQKGLLTLLVPLSNH